MKYTLFQTGFAALLFLATSTFAFAQTSSGPAGLSMEVLARYPDAADAAALSPVAGGSALRSGDEVQIRLRVERDAYVYVFAYGSSGTALLLQPFSRLPEDAFMRAGEIRIIPEADQYLPLDSRTGRESLYAIAVNAPPAEVSDLLLRMESAGDDRAAVAETVRSTFPEMAALTFRHVEKSAARSSSPVGEPPAPPPAAEAETPLDGDVAAAASIPAAPVVVDRPVAVSDMPELAAGSDMSSQGSAPQMAPPASTLLLAPKDAPVPAPVVARPIDIASGDNVSSAAVLVVTPATTGTGVLLNEGGYVLANWHVVRGYPAVAISFKGETGVSPSAAGTRVAKVVRLSKPADLALLRVEGMSGNVTAVKLAKTNEIRNGERVHAIGHLDGGEWTHTLGKIASIKAGSSWYAGHNLLHRGTVVEVELPDDPGSAGAPLLNGRLELIGIGAMPRSARGMLTGVSVETIRVFLDSAPLASGLVAGN